MEKRRNRRARFYTGGIVILLFTGLFGWMTFVQYRRVVLMRPLFAAIRGNKPQEVARLLARGADPNSRDKPTAPQTLMEMLQEMFLKRKQNREENFETALMAAADKVDPDIARMLIRQGAKVRALGPADDTALHRACASGSKAVAEMLLSHGADPNRRQSTGDTPLLLAIRDGHGACVDLLLRSGAKSTQANDVGETPLYLAVEKSNPNLFEPLLAHGANPNTADKNGTSMLTRAIWDHGADIVALLIRYHVEIRGTEEDRPLLTALRSSHSYNDTLSEAVVAKRRENIVQALLKAGADPNMREGSGPPALYEMILSGRVKEAQLLLEAGADPNSVFEDTPGLVKAASMRNPGMVQILLQYKAKPDRQNKDGTTALMIAAYNGDDDIVRSLLSAGARPQKADAGGWTAFQHAAGSRSTLALLSASGAVR